MVFLRARVGLPHDAERLAAREKLFPRTFGDFLAMLQINDPVGMLDRRQTMGYDDLGNFSMQVRDRLLDPIFH